MIFFNCISYVSFILIVTSYLLGSIPFGLLIVQLMGHGDIRKHGSGNIGATNVLRKVGKFGGLLTLFFDAGKGALAVYLSSYLCLDYLLEMACGLAVVLGHIFPIWLQFKGGKGVATSIAVILMLNIYMGLITCGIWIMIYLVSRISSLSALAAFVLNPIITYFFTYDLRLVMVSTIISILVIYRHKDNIKRLIKGTES
jgi:glycerol-3-phosphate acyltransferase PlsY